MSRNSQNRILCPLRLALVPVATGYPAPVGEGQTLPQPFEDLELDLEKPICYVIDSYCTVFIVDSRPVL